MTTELPAAFSERMRRVLDTAAFERFCAAYAAQLRRGIRVNTLKMQPESFLQTFSQPLCASPFAKNAFYVDAPFKAGADPLFHAGAYYVQEPSAGAAVTALAPQPGERVLDLCAAPGGKSTQIAAAMQGTGLLWSNEYVRQRARILEQNMERCGVRNAVISSVGAETLAAGLPAFFDAVLVDAPCSGEGMFRKEPAALADWSEQTVRRCAARQREILTAAAQTVRPGGRLVYSTCTFAPEENECMAAWFLGTHPAFEPLPLSLPFGSAGISAARAALFDAEMEINGRYQPTACRRIFPFDGGEGHFIAAFRKREDAPEDTAAGYTHPAAYTYPAADAHAKAAAALYAACFTDTPAGVPVTVGETVRLLPAGLPVLRGLGVLCAGTALALVKKNRLEPCHAAFAAARANDCRSRAEWAPDSAEIRAFLRGEELPVQAADGFTAVTTAGVTCGFGKCSGGRLKNRYPKGLRLL